MSAMTDRVKTSSEYRKIVAFPTWFILSAAVILALTGFVKTWSAFGSAKLLAVPDPITSIPFGNLMLAVGLVEILIAGICLFSKSRNLSLALVAWLATSLVMYRLGLWWIGWHKPCSCLGNLTDALHISPQNTDTAMKIILAYLFLGSYATLGWFWRQKRKANLLAASSETAVDSSV